MNTKEQYTDQALVAKIVGGEVALFEMVIRRNNASLYRIGRSYAYSHEDTQDLMQDTYMDVFAHLSSFENRSSLRTWLITIMLRHCYKKRQKWNERHMVPSEIKEQASPLFSSNQHTDLTSIIMNRELTNVIEKALLRIPLDYRMVFILREVNGLKVAETAESLDISEANVKIRLNRSKLMLRKEVEKYYAKDEIFEFNLKYCDLLVQRVLDKIYNQSAK